MAKHSLWMTTLLWVGITTAVQAQQRDLHELDSIANSVFTTNTGARAIGSPLKMSLKSSEVLQADSLATREAFYIYTPTNKSEEKFVIVSGDQRMPAILGYSDESNFDLADMPDGLKWFLKKCEADAYLASQGFTETRVANAVGEKEEFPVIEPLLGKRAWGQDAPFNQQCPAMGGGHAKTGCVATALAQIMAYHRYPATYDWDNMPDSYNGSYTQEQAEAVAKLMHDIGEACKMEYGQDISLSNDLDAEKALCTVFGYDNDIRIRQKRDYNEEDWTNLLNANLTTGYPILYDGKNPTNPQDGHAFIIDGSNSEGLYHVNWGWNGSCNGYFYINNLSTENGKNYSAHCDVIVNIHPNDSIEEADPTNIVAASITSNRKGTMATYVSSYIYVVSTSNLRYFPFEGEIQLLLTDENDSIIQHIDSPRKIIGNNFDDEYSFNIRPYHWKDIPNGQYRLRIGVRQEGYDKWGFVKGPTSIEGKYDYYDFALNLNKEQYMIGPASINTQPITAPSSHLLTLHQQEGALQFTPNTDLSGWDVISTHGTIAAQGGAVSQGEGISVETTNLPTGIYLLRGFGKDGQVYVAKFAKK